MAGLPTAEGSIARVEAFDYRCLRRVSQRLRPFQVLVGPNGSGKSTFVDAMRSCVRPCERFRRSIGHEGRGVRSER
ncbi:MAG: hypothetical protein F4089_06950 [Gammaproteobacteria bacterium]|nr:hypothetical protein [Gammaproteobacteria bacterium]